jgi:small ubiquitin-related modifier
VCNVYVISLLLGSPEGKIFVIIRDQSGADIMFRVNPDVSVEKIKSAYCGKKNISPEDVRFIFGCAGRIGPDETCRSLGIEDGDIIDCMMVQQGD